MIAEVEEIMESLELDASTAIRAVEQELNSILVDCETLIRCVLVGLVSRHHVIAIGNPGTAKTLTITQICKRVGDLSIFQFAGNKFATSDDILGPVSFKGLTEERFERILTGRAADVECCYLDEFMQFSGALQKTLLSLMAERQVTNGTNVIDVPLISMLAAANTEPTPDQNMVWDRFALRVIKEPIAADNRGRLLRLIRDGIPAPRTFMSRQQLGTLMQRAAVARIPDHVIETIINVFSDMDKAKIATSDRRRGWLLGIMRAHAVLEGRDEVNEDDLTIAPYVLWEESDHLSVVVKIVKEHMRSPLDRITDELRTKIESAYRMYTSVVANTEDREAQAQAANKSYGGLKGPKNELIAAMSKYPHDRGVKKAKDLQNEVERMISVVRSTILTGESKVK